MEETEVSLRRGTSMPPAARRAVLSAFLSAHGFAGEEQRLLLDSHAGGLDPASLLQALHSIAEIAAGKVVVMARGAQTGPV